MSRAAAGGAAVSVLVGALVGLPACDEGADDDAALRARVAAAVADRTRVEDISAEVGAPLILARTAADRDDLRELAIELDAAETNAVTRVGDGPVACWPRPGDFELPHLACVTWPMPDRPAAFFAVIYPP